jgi:hypothetical protein
VTLSSLASIPEDEIEGVFGWQRDEDRLADEKDLPHENIVGCSSPNSL